MSGGPWSFRQLDVDRHYLNAGYISHRMYELLFTACSYTITTSSWCQHGCYGLSWSGSSSSFLSNRWKCSMFCPDNASICYNCKQS